MNDIWIYVILMLLAIFVMEIKISLVLGRIERGVWAATPRPADQRPAMRAKNGD